MNMPENSFETVATKKFTALKKIYPQHPVSFWKLGNTFDTLIDYLTEIDQRNANDIADMAIQAFDTTVGNPPIKKNLNGIWFDDFGWWCVAFKRAIEIPFFASRYSELQKRHDICWQQFSGNAPFVWDRRKPTTFNAYRPAVEGGVWNEYWEGTADKYLGPKDADPRSGSLQGIQNTVTNALYLMAAQRQSAPAAQEEARKERTFLFSWLNMKDNSLWWPLDESAGLVRERVGHFAEDNATPAPGFIYDWAWAGDQGLMLGDLCDSLFHTDPITHRAIINRAVNILNGARYKLTNNHNGPIQNSTDDSATPSGDINDYQTGSGIFWRNILHIWRATNVFHPTLTSTPYQQIIRASANEASNSPDDSFDSLSNQLAALVAASVILS